MSIRQKLKHELKAVILVTLFFAAWLGVFMGLKILILEGYQIRFGNALMNAFQHRDMPHVWANTICVTGALLFYNLLATLNHHLGPGGHTRVFLTTRKDVHIL